MEPTANTTAPEQKPESAPAASPTSGGAPASQNSPAESAPAKRATNTNTRASKGGGKKAPSKDQLEKAVGRSLKAPAVKAKRSSRIAGLQEQVVTHLKKGPALVAEMSTKFKVSERDIRLAIDRARSKGEKIDRIKKNTFGYQTRRGAPKTA